jgi:type IX secretion system PorP/SprF family membrane protein
MEKNRNSRYRFTLLVLLVLLLPLLGKAQQRGYTNQFLQNIQLLNPATTGTAQTLVVQGSVRAQWVGFQDAPRNYGLFVSSPIGPVRPILRNKKRIARPFHSFGGSLTSDVTGPLSRSAGYGSYAYNLPLTYKLRLSFGAQVGFQQVALNASRLILSDPSAGGITDYISLTPDAGLGLMLYSQRFLYSVSIQQVFARDLSLSASGLGTFKAQPHLIQSIGYQAALSDQWEALPSLMLRYVTPLRPAVDVLARFKHRSGFWLSGGYTVGNSGNVAAGVQLESGIRFCYSYEVATSKIGPFSRGSHEIIAGYVLPYTKKATGPISNFWY